MTAYSESRYSLNARAHAAGNVSPLAAASARNSRHAWGAWLTMSMKSRSAAERFVTPTAAPNSFQVSASTRTLRWGGDSSVTGSDGTAREGGAATGVMPPSLPYGPDFVVTNLHRGGTVGGANSTKPRSRLSQHQTGFRGNQPLMKKVAAMTLQTTAVVVPNDAAGITYHVSCGQCPDANGEPRVATHVIGYDSTDLDGEPIGERLYTCVPCFGETYVWAEAQNRSFVPPTIDRIPVAPAAPVSSWAPRCAFCGTPYYECQTDSRGLCVAGSVTA